MLMWQWVEHEKSFPIVGLLEIIEDGVRLKNLLWGEGGEGEDEAFS